MDISKKTVDLNLLFFGNSVDSDNRLADLRQFAEHVDAFITREDKFLKEVVPAGDAPEFSYLFAEAFPTILHSSIVISTAMLLEQEMRGFSDAFLKGIGSELKFSDLSGSVLDRFKTLMTKIANQPFDVDCMGWEDVVGLFEIRNSLIHSGARLENFNKAGVIRAFALRHSTPEIHKDEIVVNAATSEQALDISGKFLAHIYDLSLAAFPGRYKPRRTLYGR